ncbi:hypothetical protein ANTRET_LOCUS6274 [Anthophora retusa]
MIIASEKVSTTVDVTVNVNNIPVYCNNNISKATMENTANVNFYTTETANKFQEDILISNENESTYRAGFTDLSAIFEKWRERIIVQNISSSVEHDFSRMPDNELGLVNIEEARYKSKSLSMVDHEVSYHYPFTDYIRPRVCADFSPISTYSKPHHRLVRNLKSITINSESNLRNDRRNPKRAYRMSHLFFRGKRRRTNGSSLDDQEFKLKDQWNKTFLLTKLLEASHVERNISESISSSPNRSLYAPGIPRLNAVSEKSIGFVKKRRKRNIANRRETNTDPTHVLHKEMTAYVDTLKMLLTTNTPHVESQLTYNTEHQSEIDILQTTRSWSDHELTGTTMTSDVIGQTVTDELKTFYDKQYEEDYKEAYEDEYKEETTKEATGWYEYDEHIGTIPITPRKTSRIFTTESTTTILTQGINIIKYVIFSRFTFY